VLLNAVASLKTKHMVDDPVLLRYVAEMGSRYSRLRMASEPPGVDHDQLFVTDDDHPVDASCGDCDSDRMIRRP
jgi:hypothetical protein